MSSLFFSLFFGDTVLNNTYHKLPAHNGGVACVLLLSSSLLLSSVVGPRLFLRYIFPLFWFRLFFSLLSSQNDVLE